MAKMLNKKETGFLDDLEKNFDKQVEKYKKEKEQQLKEGKRKELEEELKNLISYVEGASQTCICGKAGHELPPPISDTSTNIKFKGAKTQVLKELLNNRRQNE